MLSNLFFNEYGFLFGSLIIPYVALAGIGMFCLCMVVVPLEVKPSYFMLSFFCTMVVIVSGACAIIYGSYKMAEHMMPDIGGAISCYKVNDSGEWHGLSKVADYGSLKDCIKDSDAKIVVDAGVEGDRQTMLTAFPSLVQEPLKQKYKQCLDLLREHRVEVASGAPHIATEMAMCAWFEHGRKRWDAEQVKAAADKQAGQGRAAKVQEIRQKEDEVMRSLFGDKEVGGNEHHDAEGK